MLAHRELYESRGLMDAFQRRILQFLLQYFYIFETLDLGSVLYD